MVTRTPDNPHTLYEVDETAWLEKTADLLRQGRIDEIDTASLAEYLNDMAKRDRREVFSRLVVVLTHLMKWDHQPDRRSHSWRATIREQRRELRQLLESGTLWNHAEAVLIEAYREARLQAADETGIDVSTFAESLPWTLVQVLDAPIA